MKITLAFTLSIVLLFARQARAQSSEFIAYHSCPPYPEFCNVVLQSIDGSKTAVIENAAQAAWSPAGDRIAYVKGGFGGGVFVLNLNDWSSTPVHQNAASSVAWSPDGSKLAVAWDELYVMNADGSGVVRLTYSHPPDFLSFLGDPDWSADGTKIAFDCAINYLYWLCLINADGTDFRILTADAEFESGAAFSHDGRSFASSSTRFGPPGIGVDGVGITPQDVYGVTPAWSPDDSQIAFSSGDSIYLINRDRTNLRWFSSGNSPAWSLQRRPVAWFNAQGCNGLNCIFDGSGSWSGASPIVSYAWTFGDGQSSAGPTANHAYSAPGTYRVTLTVTDDSGTRAIQSRDVAVPGNLWPVARFIASCSGYQCTFDGSASSDPDGTIATYRWLFGDGSSSSGTPIVTHRYTSSNMYTVTLIVLDAAGAEGRQQQVLDLSNTPPSATFTISCVELNCTFDGSGSTDSDGLITSYAWSFGDGATAAGVTANHTYGVPGIYTNTLTISDNNGHTATDTRSVTVTQSVHIGDTDGANVAHGNTWDAVITFRMHRATHAPAADVFVNGSWSVGGTATCQSGTNGHCIVVKSGISRKTKSVTFTINSVTGPVSLYSPTENHDPDGDSSGTSVTVSNP